MDGPHQRPVWRGLLIAHFQLNSPPLSLLSRRGNSTAVNRYDIIHHCLLLRHNPLPPTLKLPASQLLFRIFVKRCFPLDRQTATTSASAGGRMCALFSVPLTCWRVLDYCRALTPMRSRSGGLSSRDVSNHPAASVVVYLESILPLRLRGSPSSCLLRCWTTPSHTDKSGRMPCIP